MKIKTSELTGAALDWVVAKCEGYLDDCNSWLYEATLEEVEKNPYHPSTDWAQGGVILEREEVGFAKYGPNGTWKAVIGEIPRGIPCYAPTPLIAAMRCFCASRLGDEVDVPEELAALVKGE